jgi:hypothetical protein
MVRTEDGSYGSDVRLSKTDEIYLLVCTTRCEDSHLNAWRAKTRDVREIMLARYTLFAGR